MNEHEKWMQIAIQEAIKAEKMGEVPVGAILVKNNLLIAKAHNQPIAKNDATAHAEIEVLRKAGAKLQNYRLPKTTLYVTLEPCPMCLGAMVHARIERIVFGASDPKSGACGSTINLSSESIFNHQILVNAGILEQECKNILKSFFKLRRK
jgi:tRNA(adenine34) deaminase